MTQTDPTPAFRRRSRQREEARRAILLVTRWYFAKGARAVETGGPVYCDPAQIGDTEGGEGGGSAQI